MSESSIQVVPSQLSKGGLIPLTKLRIRAKLMNSYSPVAAMSEKC